MVLPHRTPTDQVKRVQLTSQIERVAWTTQTASAGALAGLEILTHFVGNQSPLEIELSDQSGKTIGKYKEKISGNRFWTNIRVPSGAKDALYAEAKLTKLGLQAKSGPMIVLPPVEITNLKWDKKEARRGEILKLTADTKNVPDGAEGEISIWEYDSDGGHDFITKFPVLVKGNKVEAEWEYEYHEDTDEIPTADETGGRYRPPEYFFRISIEGIIVESGLLIFRDWLIVTVGDHSGKPIPNLEYQLRLADGSIRRGRLDLNGSVKLEDIPPGKIEVQVRDNR